MKCIDNTIMTLCQYKVKSRILILFIILEDYKNFESIHILSLSLPHTKSTSAYLYVHNMYCIAVKFGELALFEHLANEIWQINRSANTLLIVCTNLDGFSLANHR